MVIISHFPVPVFFYPYELRLDSQCAKSIHCLAVRIDLASSVPSPHFQCNLFYLSFCGRGLISCALSHSVSWSAMIGRQCK